MATHSTRRRTPKKPTKPRPDFPLFPHARGYWAKKVRGQLKYFGKVADDPKGEAALNLWLDQKDALLAGREPRQTSDGLTIRDLCNHFLTFKEDQRDCGELAAVTYTDYYRACEQIIDAFGKSRLVDDLSPDDFLALRQRLGKKYGIHRRSNTIQRVRSIFKYGYDADLIDKVVRFGPGFKLPSKKNKRLHRQEQGQKKFEAAQIRMLIDNASQPLKAMIYLGINCGFGNADCGKLTFSSVDFKNGWIDFPRPKTAVERRCPLWRETITALKESIAVRPTPRDDRHSSLVFVTKYGQSWWKEREDNPIAKEFRKLVVAIDSAASEHAKERRGMEPEILHRRGVGFYALRHTFETEGGASLDQIAVDRIMGHADQSMAEQYREKIDDKRLLAVVEHIYKWLGPHKQQKKRRN